MVIYTCVFRTVKRGLIRETKSKPCKILEVRNKTSTESRVVGDVYWTDSPVDGYND